MDISCHRRGFTLIEVMVATIILATGLVVLLTSFMNCQKVMMASQDFEDAQYVLSLGETAYPIPAPDQVDASGEDVFDHELMRIEEKTVDELLDALELERLPAAQMERLQTYTFERTVDEVDEEELKRSGWLYTVRTRVRWGHARNGRERDGISVLTLWRKKGS